MLGKLIKTVLEYLGSLHLEDVQLLLEGGLAHLDLLLVDVLRFKLARLDRLFSLLCRSGFRFLISEFLCFQAFEGWAK